MQTNHRKRFDQITLIGFVMICLIVLYHAAPVLALGYDTVNRRHYFINTVFSFLAIAAMSWFFSMTGFLLFRGFSLRRYAGKIGSRIRSLLIPYILWQAIVAIVYIAVYAVKYHGDSRYDVLSALKNTFLLTDHPPDSALWYVYAVFFLALLSPLVCLLLKNRWIGVCVLLISGITVAYIRLADFYRAVEAYPLYDGIVGYLPAYLIGSYFGLHDPELTKPRLLVFTGVHLIAGAVLCFAVTGFYSTMDLFQIGFCAILPILLIYLFAKVKLPKRRGIFRCSFLIYAMHQPVFLLYGEPFSLAVERRFRSAAAVNLTVRFTALIVIVCAAVLLHALLNRFAPRVLKVLTGGRC